MRRDGRGIPWSRRVEGSRVGRSADAMRTSGEVVSDEGRMHAEGRGPYRRSMLRHSDVEEGSEAPSADAVRAMFDVVQGMSSTDAWLRYLRARHPDAVDVLARAAMTDMAIELLVEHGDLSRDEAVAQRAEAEEMAARLLPARDWNEIRQISQILEELAEVCQADAEIVDLNDGSWRRRRAPA
jgi:hypothetical protein